VVQEKSMIVYTVVNPELRVAMLRICHQLNIVSVDLLGPILTGLGKFFGYEPKMASGILHNVDERYFRKIEAIEYTIAHDDGKDLTNLDRADLIILGISRTSKTPLSMYFSHYGWKVANVPLIHGFEVPAEVLAVDPRRVVALTIDPDELAKIRRNRLERLGQQRGGDYADLGKVVDEVEYANTLFRKFRKWSIFNVTGKAVEETAAEIIKLMTARNLVPPGI
jgi:regulator of PEP synthase PpsR (kinase-PPPase family)